MPVCTTLSDGCIVCPEQPAQPARPAVWSTTIPNGWDAYAKSATEISGDCYTEFSAQLAGGIVCGLARVQGAYLLNDVVAGVALSIINGFPTARLVQYGVPFGVPTPHAATDAYRIERVGSTVQVFRLRDAAYELLGTIPAPFSATACVVAFLYSGGDTIE